MAENVLDITTMRYLLYTYLEAKKKKKKMEETTSEHK